MGAAGIQFDPSSAEGLFSMGSTGGWLVFTFFVAAALGSEALAAGLFLYQSMSVSVSRHVNTPLQVKTPKNRDTNWLTCQQVAPSTCMCTTKSKREADLCTYISIMTATITPSSAKKHTLTMTAIAMRARDCTFNTGS